MCVWVLTQRGSVEVWFGGWGRGVHIAHSRAGQQESLPSPSKDHFVVTDSFWHRSPRAGILQEPVKKKKKKNRSRESQREQREEKKKKTWTDSVAWTLPVKYRIPHCEAVFSGSKKKWNSRDRDDLQRLVWRLWSGRQIQRGDGAEIQKLLLWQYGQWQGLHRGLVLPGDAEGHGSQER